MLLANVEKVKTKLVRWRKFTRTTLHDEENKKWMDKELAKREVEMEKERHEELRAALLEKKRAEELESPSPTIDRKATLKVQFVDDDKKKDDFSEFASHTKRARLTAE